MVRFICIFFRITVCEVFKNNTGLAHTQGIQGNSGNFQARENLRETQGILIFF